MELSRICEACGEGTVRTICNECREFYCQNCSDYHLRFKATRDHHLIDLHPEYGDQQKKTSESADEVELSSDFVEELTVTEHRIVPSLGRRGPRGKYDSTAGAADNEREHRAVPSPGRRRPRG